MSRPPDQRGPTATMEERQGWTTEELKLFEHVENRQKTLHEKVKGKESLDEGAKRAAKCKSFDEAVAVLNGATTKIDRFQDKHKTGWRKLTRNFEGFVSAVQDLLRSINPLLNIVKEFGAPYSGLAIGTISLFFYVAATKRSMDNQVASIITQIRDRLPGFQVYQWIYGQNYELSNDLKKKILLAYSQFTLFALDATLYYMQHGYRRWVTAIFKPNKFQERGNDVQDRILAVRLRCEELLNESIDQLKKVCTYLQERTDETTELETLDHFKQTLQLSGWSRDSRKRRFDEYRRAFAYEQPAEDLCEKMDSRQIEKKKNTDSYRTWEKVKKSAMLILIGRNNLNLGYGLKHCWASPFAWAVFEDLQRLSVTHAFHFCSVYESTSLHEVIPEVLLQLLDCKRSILRDRDRIATLNADLHKYQQWYRNSKDEQQDDGGKLLQDITKGVFNLFHQNDTIYVILDRIDRCSASDKSTLLRLFADIMRAPGCTIKVLIIASNFGWDVSDGDLQRIAKGDENFQLRQLGQRSEDENN